MLVLSHALSAGNVAAGATSQEQLRAFTSAFRECDEGRRQMEEGEEEEVEGEAEDAEGEDEDGDAEDGDHGDDGEEEDE